MKTPAQLAAETRKMYLFEDMCVRSHFLLKERSMKYLRAYAERVWQAERIKRPLPDIVAGDGARQGDKRYSYCISTGRNTSRIVLARHERNLAVLLHELVHALGEHYGPHNKRFVKKLLHFLVVYGRENEKFLLTMSAFTFGNWVKELTH